MKTARAGDRSCGGELASGGGQGLSVGKRHGPRRIRTGAVSRASRSGRTLFMPANGISAVPGELLDVFRVDPGGAGRPVARCV